MSSSVEHLSPDLSLPRLELPDWLPGPVADEAKSIYDRILQKERQREDEAEPSKTCRSCLETSLRKIELLSRLTSDKRMKGVWRELYRQKRRPRDEFLNPAIRVGIMFEPTLPILHDPKNQDEACREFLGVSFGLAVRRSSLPKQDEINFRRKSLCKIAGETAPGCADPDFPRFMWNSLPTFKPRRSVAIKTPSNSSRVNLIRS